ncbi:cellular tumor antigen p53 isoform X2 [Aricia agestis]|uniref:cellular tumor antigen p53 isoform X2 n=1 Tax=Aricia agestis TaxID=91739 RepID=UPI001C20BA81|nr:cellular tumor antigen p53 isoform X2 [Aricia agestis]
MLHADDFNLAEVGALTGDFDEYFINGVPRVSISDIEIDNFSEPKTEPYSFINPVSPTGPPHRVNFSGEYNFNLEINAVHTQKNKYLYSHKLHRIYVVMKENFSVNFNWNTTNIQQPLYVRATVVFSDAAQAEKRVERCSQHFYEQSNLQAQITSEAERRNVLRSARAPGSPGVFYCGSPQTVDSWYSVLVEFPAPSSHAYTFVCKSSCTSGINRRAISIIFTLEDMAGNVFGRDSVGVRVCSCPRRDMRRDEKAEPTAGKRRLTRPPRPPSPDTPPAKVIKVEKNHEQNINLQVSLVGKKIAISGLNVMYDMTKLLRDQKHATQQPVEDLDRALSDIQREIDRLKNTA